MSTANEMLEQILLDLEGYTTSQERLALLNGSLTSAASSIPVKGNVVLVQGIVEIGRELVYVGSVNDANGTLGSCIRGYRGSTASAHSDNDIVRENPKIPRISVQRAMDDTIRNLAPRVVAVQQESILTSGGTINYPLPAGALDVISVQYSIPGGSGLTPKSRRWKFNRDSSGTPTISLFEFIPGYSALVTYATSPTPISDTADFEDTGLPYWCEPLVRAGAVSKLAQFLDAPNYVAWTAAQHNQNAATPVGGSLRLTQFLLASFEDQVAKASARQRKEWDILTHYTG